MSLPNELILFNNHFVMHRRHYPYRTRLAIAADTGYDGYEFHPIEPGDDKTWGEATAAFRASGLRRAGIYIVAKGINDDECDKFDAEVNRAKGMIDRLAAIDPQAFVNFTILSNPGGNVEYAVLLQDPAKPLPKATATGSTAPPGVAATSRRANTFVFTGLAQKALVNPQTGRLGILLYFTQKRALTDMMDAERVNRWRVNSLRVTVLGTLPATASPERY